MAKDPAFLFYSADFLTGTYTMTDEQVGKYIRLLCLQHQKDVLTEKDMNNICKTYDEDIYCKFTKENDLYFNVRLKKESEKRKNYSLSRAKNRENKKTATHEEHMNNICNTYDEHMENENVNINKDIINYLNNKINTNYKSSTAKTKSIINARIKEGFSLSDFKKVIDNKVSDWKDKPEMQIYLRPETLFGTKFESYLNEAVSIKNETKKIDEIMNKYIDFKLAGENV